MPSNDEILSSFIEGAPPGQTMSTAVGSLNPVRICLLTKETDIKALVGAPTAEKQIAAFRRHNEQQLVTVKLPGSSQEVLVSRHNALGDDRYYDTASQTSFSFDHITRQASASQSHVLETKQTDLIKSLSKLLDTHSSEHYPQAATGIYPCKDDSGVVVCLVSNKYSLNNFWSGRWRAEYTYIDSSLSGSINLDIHYFEDGNVRLQTTKHIEKMTIESSAGSATNVSAEVIKFIATAERRYQEALNKTFPRLNEDAFKNLRRQLPVTRQKVDWDKIGGYRLGQDIAGQTK